MKSLRAVRAVAVAVCTVALAACLGGCFGSSPSSSSTQLVVPEHPYSWSNLDYHSGRYAYYMGGKDVGRIGIDVSDHNGSIDWKAVANDGVDFAFIRLGNRGYTEGGIYLDEQFEANLAGAQAAGLNVGVYFFSQAVTEEEAVEEAEFVIRQLKGRWLSYPVVFDEETVPSANGRANKLTRTEQTAIARAFLERIEQGGYEGMLYFNRADMYRFDLVELGQWPVWFAEYGTTPNATPDFVIWQYASSGNVAGVPGSVDLNIDLNAAR